MRNLSRRFVPSLLLCVLVLSSGSIFNNAPEKVVPKRTGSMPSTYDFVHDPSMAKDGNTYYVFSTGDPNVNNGNIQIRASQDLKHWSYLGTVFSMIPTWLTNQVPGIVNIWAPDVSYFKGHYQIFYAGSTFGSNSSVIALATNKTLNPKSKLYHWVDRGMVLQSSPADNWNAIDPNFILDSKGKPWLVFGSFWSGIKLVQLNDKLRAIGTLHSLVYRPKPPDAVEAPFIISHNSYYYLFVSFGFCCRGVNSTYRIMMGRSQNITGPYVDEKGNSMMNGGGTLLLGNQGSMIGPGGQSVLTSNGKSYMIYHYYDALAGGNAKLQIRMIYWTKKGWPVLGGPIVPVPNE